MEDEHRACYRRCFGTPDGKKVLANILIELGYFDTVTEESALRDYAASLIKTLGFSDQPSKVEQMVEKWFEINQES